MKNHTRYLVIIAVIMIAAIVAVVMRPIRGAAQFRVGVMLFDRHAVIEEISAGFVSALNAEAARRETTVEYETRSADGNTAQAEAVARYFRDSDVDMVFVVGIPAAQALKTGGVTKPVVFGGPPDPIAAGLVPSLTKHETNFTGTKYFPSQTATVATLQAIRPTARRVAILHNPAEANSAALVAAFRSAAADRSLAVQSFPAGNTVELEAALRQINRGDIDAVFLPTDNFIYSALDRVIQDCTRKGVDTFSVTRLAVERGALFSVGADYHRVGELTAGVAVPILFERRPPQDVDVFDIEEGQIFVKSGVTLTPPTGYRVTIVNINGHSR